MRFGRAMFTGAGLLALSACSGGPQFTTVPQNLMQAVPAGRVMAQVDAAGAPSDPFQATLFREYARYAHYEYDAMMDYVDTVYLGRKALAAAHGETVEPQAPGERRLTPAASSELSSAWARLTAVLNGGGPEKAPEATAKAQAAYDCWLEQQEENFQPEDIAKCRKTFFDNLEQAEAALKPPVPAVITLSADVLFDFDKAVIKDSFKPKLDEIAELLKQHPDIKVYVDGHTDTAGPADYNMKLSERRARAVADYLIARGVDADRIMVRAFGETRLAVPTPDNTPEPRNRRVEIRRR